MAFEVTPAPAPSTGFAVEAAPTPAPAPAGQFQGFIQVRVNGVDVGDNRVGVIDFLTS